MCSMASRDQNRKQTLVVDSIEYTLAVRALIAALTATVDTASAPLHHSDETSAGTSDNGSPCG